VHQNFLVRGIYFSSKAVFLVRVRPRRLDLGRCLKECPCITSLHRMVTDGRPWGGLSRHSGFIVLQCLRHSQIAWLTGPVSLGFFSVPAKSYMFFFAPPCAGDSGPFLLVVLTPPRLQEGDIRPRCDAIATFVFSKVFCIESEAGASARSLLLFDSLSPPPFGISAAHVCVYFLSQLCPKSIPIRSVDSRDNQNPSTPYFHRVK